ncbi:amino acid adenylation domain-containing protein [Streptomyces sp. LP11]|uniref:Amino acid adenylation domain-containing protein n=1 Tax=Streptomyces pyxinicus TaxID=2970331 RepID=A0ABT2B5P9_9ACTN|nr:amino acid adenylation domain-containing protein [Streptomyces sp. LP11]MCS0603405.1 amino acid adenylation domain-containing protein [Streptomyces sp. LP11]
MQPVPRPVRPAPTVRPASFAQQRLWFLAQLPGASVAYNETIAFTLTGPLDRHALRAAFDRLTERHETLRTRLVAEAGGVVQHIDPPGSGFALACEDLTGEADPDATVTRRQQQEAARPFDLEHGPLGRGSLLILGAERHVLLLTFHHSVYDGASMNVMMREAGELYAASLTGAPDPLPALPAQYADHAHAQREAVLGGGLAAQEQYWKQALRDAPVALELPTDRPRPAEQDYTGGRVEFTLDADTTTALRGLARRHGATLFVALLTGWSVLLSRLSGQEDIVVGSPVAGRRGPGAAALIGFLVNSLPLRVDLSGAPTASEALTRTRTAVRDALAHQDLPFERVVELVNPPRSASRTPVFQTMLAWVPDRHDLLRLPGVEAAPLPIADAPAKFDLALAATESQGGITGHLDYASALLDHTTAQRWASHLCHLLTDLTRHPERDVRDLELMGPDERLRLIREGDATALAPTDPASAALRTADGIASLFESQARRHPDRTAVVDRDGTLGYAVLDRRANRLAHALAARAVRPGDVVGLHARRTRDLAVGILGILKAGAAYLPLDPQQPRERLTGMVADAACPVVLSDHAPGDRPDEWLDLAAVESEGATAEIPPAGTGRAPDRLAYVIFTSGSTGRPKGVAVEHRSVLNLFATWQDRMGAAPGEAGSAWSSIGFDASVHELLLPLTTGGAVHIVPEDVRADPDALMAWLREHRIVQAFLPPAYVKWIDEDPAGRLRGLSLRKLLTGVESLTEAALHRMTRHLPGLRICFGYGPTEATLYSTAHYDPRPLERPCPIGRPLPGTRFHLLDGRMRPVPPGVVGEVYLGGASLARGYLGRPDLTDERFVPDPFTPGERLYRTGDLARRDHDGHAHYAGRADDQVKLRGFRIEPAEVEAALMALPGVREAVVLADRDAAGQPRLVAGVGRAAPREHGADDPRTALARRLPDYMIPAVVLELDSLPLNRSGKADRAELLRLVHERTSDQVNTAAPRDHVEHALYRIWQDILVHPGIGVGDNFFDIGGTSLSAIKMAHRVTETFGRPLPVAEVMLRPTIESLGALLREDGDDRAPGSLIEFRRGTGARVVCVHPAGGTAFCYLPLAASLPPRAGLYGIQSPGVNPGEDVLPTVEAMAEAYLRLLEPLGDGPLVLTGLSYGGLVAHEMGRLLGRAGRRDVSVVLLDTQATDDAAARAEITAVDPAEFRDKLVRFNGMYPGIDDAQVERYYRIYNHNRLTARDHLPAASPARLVLAQAVPDGADTPFHAEVREFWRRRAEGEFRVETLECDHWEVLEGDQAIRVGALLTAELVHHGTGRADARALATSAREA